MAEEIKAGRSDHVCRDGLRFTKDRSHLLFSRVDADSCRLCGCLYFCLARC